jgi:hypothetical protein
MTDERGIVEKVEAVIARTWHGKHVSAARNQYARIEKLLEAMISMWSMPRILKKGQQQQQLSSVTIYNRASGTFWLAERNLHC